MRTKKLMIAASMFAIISLLAEENDYGPKAPAPDNIPVSRHYTQTALQNKQARALFIGDSITDQWLVPTDSKYPGGLEVWKKTFPFAHNFGISGDETGHLLWRITEGKQLDGCRYNVIVLMIGTNNILRSKRNPQTKERIAHGIHQIIEIMKKKQPQAKILLLSILPLHFDDGERDKMARDILPLTKALADEKTVFFLDLTKVFLNDRGKVINMNDGVHPSPAGYEKTALPILEKIQELEQLQKEKCQ